MTYDGQTPIDLTQFDDAFAEAENGSDQQTDAPIPDGKYIVNVERVELKTSKAGNPMLRWGFKIIDGPQKNRWTWKQNMLMDSVGVGYLKKDLHTCGLDLDKLSDLTGRLAALLDLTLEIVVKVNKKNADFTDVWINKRIDATQPNASRPPASKPEQQRPIKMSATPPTQGDGIPF